MKAKIVEMQKLWPFVSGLIEDQLPEFARRIKEYAKSDEDVLMYALFPQQAKDFLGRREDLFYDVPLQTVDVTLDLQ